MDHISETTIYKLLSDDLRLKIVKMLIKSNMNVSEIIERCGRDQPLISHKLKELRENGILISYRSGKNIVYRVSDPYIKKIIDTVEAASLRIKQECKYVECNGDKS
ncbi:ArsR/SmtB family transcription factor [Picrophilus oshimae]|nr:metalloregulator ArsR/SmtB family transcription factor [Picrophilus oshimae]